MVSMMPNGVDRVRNREMVCGNTSSETKNLTAPFFFWSLLLSSKSMVMASAAAVLSSKSEAFARAIPVRSHITV